MLTHVKSFLKCLVAAAALAWPGRAVADAAVRVAQPAPKFAAKDVFGRDVKLSQFAGKPLLVCFWLTGDGPSREQIAVLAKIHEQFAGNGLTVIGMAVDPEGAAGVKKFVEQQQIKFVVAPADYKLAQDFGGITAVPTTFVIDENHNIIERFVGVTEKDALETSLRLILKK
jgi:cytochrome c biogenesis protein CcmG/thiol:disulfide interchange protein DsbE